MPQRRQVEQVRNAQAQLESELLQCPFTPKLSTWSPDSRCGGAGVLPTSELASQHSCDLRKLSRNLLPCSWLLGFVFPGMLFCIACSEPATLGRNCVLKWTCISKMLAGSATA